MGRLKTYFEENVIQQIVDLYVVKGLGTAKIGELFNVSKRPIIGVLREKGVLRNGLSDGRKILLTDAQKNAIRRMYLIEYKNCDEIAVMLGLTRPFVNKYLSVAGYRRDKNMGSSVGLVRRFSGLSYGDYLLQTPELKKYKRAVMKVTLKQPIHTLPNFNKRGITGVAGVYHLDHKYSILEGFKNKINPEVIGNINNLEFIPWEVNIQKRTRCSIKLSNLS